MRITGFPFKWSVTQKIRAFFIMCLCAAMLFSGCVHREYSEDLEEYLQSEAPIVSDLRIFPSKESLQQEQILRYNSETVQSVLFDDYYFLLKYQCTDDEYTLECQRLQDLGTEYEEDLFRIPAYVMVYSTSSYEYVLVDAAQQILIYVCIQSPDVLESFPNFPEEYLPTPVQED